MKAITRYLFLTLLTVLVSPGGLLADESQRGGVGVVDYGVLGLYVLGTIFLGYFISCLLYTSPSPRD